MALIHSKQLNPKLTGSFVISGSEGLSVIGGLTADSITTSQDTITQGKLTVTGNISGSGNLDIDGNATIDGTTNLGGNVTLQNNLTAVGFVSSSNINVTGHITASGDISASGTIFADNFQSTGGDVAGISFSDDLNLTGDLTASGNLSVGGRIDVVGDISGSATTTGSFGKISMHDDTHLNSNGFAISGSASSTASFGMVKIHAIAGNSPITFTDTIIERQNIEVLGQITASGNVDVGGDLSVAQYIKHKGDDNTFINFTDNRIRMNAGGINFLTLEDDGSAPYPFVINNGGNRINFRVMDRNNDLLFKTDSEALNVGLYYAGNKKLETKSDGIEVSGNITATGDIIAESLIVSSSVTNMIIAEKSGSTTFGDDSGDTHRMTGSLLVTGSLNVETGRIFEQGTSVIDHATAMAIVFGG